MIRKEKLGLFFLHPPPFFFLLRISIVISLLSHSGFPCPAEKRGNEVIPDALYQLDTPIEHCGANDLDFSQRGDWRADIFSRFFRSFFSLGFVAVWYELFC